MTSDKVSSPVGLKEIAEKLGVRHSTAKMWHYRGVLPKPVGTVSGAPCWDWADVKAWARATNRLSPES